MPQTIKPSRPPEISIREVGLFRIALGLYLIYYYLSLLPNLFHYFGPNSMVNLEINQNLYFSLLYGWGWQPAGIVCLYILTVGLVILFMIGQANLLSFVSLLILQLSFHNANPLILHEPQPLTNLFLFIFLLLPRNTSPVFSLQKIIPLSIQQIKETRELVNILVFFLGVYYFIVGLKKIPDPLWLNGTALSYLLAQPFLGKENFLTAFVLSSPLISKILCYTTLLFELTFIFFVFTKWRWVYFVGGVFLHLAIMLTMEVGTVTHIFLVWYVLLLSDAQSIKNSDNRDYSF